MKSRKGLSTVIGAIFFVIAASSTIGYVTYSMNTIDKYNQSILEKNQEDANRGAENFEITKVTIDSNKFNVTIQNTGNFPISIKRLWVENTTDTDDVDRVFRYDIDKVAFPGEKVTKIGQNLPLYANTAQSYNLKLVTERGNVQQFLIKSVDTVPVYMKLYALPETIISDFSATLLFTVTNNMTNNDLLVNIVPEITPIEGDAEITCSSETDPPSYPSLAKGDTAYFKLTCKINGNPTDTKTFRASLQNGYPDNAVTATVTVVQVLSSLQSGTSVETLGLSTVNLTPNHLLVLHQETTDALNGRQMYSSDSETSGLTLDTGTSPTNYFFTKNDTESTADIGSGVWNASLRFISKSVPDGIISPDLIYHFESGSTTTLDSSGNSRDITLVNGPSLVTGGGKHGTNAFSFDGINDYMQGPSTLNTKDNIGTKNDTTSGWFKTSSTTLARKVIYRVGNSGDNGEYYEIVLGDGSDANNKGKLFFRFSTKSASSSPQGMCSSSASNLNDGDWHHFVAVRDGERTCKLYVDRTLAGQDNDNSCGSCSGNQADQDTVTVTGPANIGRNPATSSEYFPGTIDQIFHWNGYALDLTRAQKLYDANYGANAHAMHFKLEKTDAQGNNPVVIKDDPNYPIKFQDGKGVSNWATNINYTTGTNHIDEKIIDGGDRLKFTIEWQSGLNMTLRIDDQNMINPRSTYLQVPNLLSGNFPGYYTYKISTSPQVSIVNKGPYGSWLTYLTRIVFDDVSSTNSYAGHIESVGGFNMDNGGIRTDSPLFKVDQQYTLVFKKPRSTPDATNSANDPTLIVPGQYKMSIFLSGYDERGAIFLRTIYFGTIRVIN